MCLRSCVLSNEMPSSSAAPFSGSLCGSVLLMRLHGLWEYGDEAKRAFQISALQIKATKDKVTIHSQENGCSLHPLLFFLPKCMAARLLASFTLAGARLNCLPLTETLRW